MILMSLDEYEEIKDEVADKATAFEKSRAILKGGIRMTNETVQIDNPCYHCYTGAIGECYGIGCKYVSYPWSGDLETDYKVEIEKEEKKC